MGAEGTEGRLSLPGRDVAYLRFGPGDAPPVLCLHGWLDNAHSFLPLARALPDLQLIAVDLPGHGKSSPRAAGAAYHQLDWVIDAVEIVDALGLQHFALMGHSMGAGIAALTAGVVADRVKALVLLEGTGPRPTAADETVVRLRAHLAARRALAAMPESRGGQPATALRARLSFSDPLLTSSAELLVQRGVRPAKRGVTFSHDRSLQREQPNVLGEDQIRAFLAAITAPSLLVMADDGVAYDGEMVAGRRAAIGSLQYVSLPGGHHVHMDDAPGVAAHVGPFLRAHA